jgi:hypothetical protein
MNGLNCKFKQKENFMTSKAKENIWATSLGRRRDAKLRD